MKAALILCSLMIVSVTASASSLIVNRAIAHADAIEALDARLHEIGQDEKAEVVHSLEAVALNIVEIFERGEATQQIVFNEMRALVDNLHIVIRVVGGPGAGMDEATSVKLNAVIDTYNALFFSVYPSSGGCRRGCR